MLAVVASFHPRIGGGEKYAERYLSGFADLGARVEVLTSVDGIDGTHGVGPLLVHYVPARRVAGFPFYSFSMMDRYAAGMRANIIQTIAPAVHDFPLAAYARIKRLPLVAVYHADLKDNRGIGFLATLLHNQTVLRSATHVVTTNERLAEGLVRRGLRRNRVTAATPGVDDRFFDAAAKRDIDLLFVGALDEYHDYKRLDLLFDAVARLRDEGSRVRLAVVGSGNRLDHFRKLAAARGIGAAVTFHGHVPNDDLPGFYAGARVLVLPSPTTQEGFGIVCLEAIASGTPVVCSVAAGASAIVARTPGCATWDGKDVDDLVRAIRMAREASAETRWEIARIGRDFSWRRMSDVFARRLFLERGA